MNGRNKAIWNGGFGFLRKFRKMQIFFAVMDLRTVNKSASHSTAIPWRRRSWKDRNQWGKRKRDQLGNCKKIAETVGNRRFYRCNDEGDRRGAV